MTQRTTRRKFLKTTAAAGVGFWVAGGIAPRKSRAANEEIRFACVGVGGKGSSDSADADRAGKVVAICDIDEETLNKAAAKFPDAKQYYDYRKMLEEMEKSIDAVTVSTPDHTHTHASVVAMRLGKACFCQKPLTKSIYEARFMGELAKEMGVATQMGNQFTADSTLRRSAALIKAGVIGTVKEVHVWTNRPVWPQGIDLPTDNPPVPDHIHWAEWIGPAPMRPYNPIYHPFKWRGWWDFGTGALGDMACHTVNMSFMALNIRDPKSVQATTTGHNGQTYPKSSVIEFEFPELDGRPAFKMTWYDGGERPPADWFAGRNVTNSGALVVGDKGSLYSPGDYGGDSQNTGIIVDGEFQQQRRLREPMVEYPRSPGHFQEFANAVRDGEPAMSNFPNYAGPLTETILLGNLAVWAAGSGGQGPKIEWDAKNLQVTNGFPELAEIVKPTYHNGYSLEMS